MSDFIKVSLGLATMAASSSFGHVHSLTEVGGIAGAKLRWLAIGAVEQGNGSRYASAWRAPLGDVGKRFDDNGFAK